jgi:hypothetical protein
MRFVVFKDSGAGYGEGSAPPSTAGDNACVPDRPPNRSMPKRCA